jgi:hypothetical protein
MVAVRHADNALMDLDKAPLLKTVLRSLQDPCSLRSGHDDHAGHVEE